MEKPVTLNSMLASVVALYFVFAVIYHHCMRNEWLRTTLPEDDVAILTGLSTEGLVSHGSTFIIYAVFAAVACWFIRYSTDTDQYHSTGVLGITLGVWGLRTYLLQPLYLLTSLETRDIGALAATIVVLVPLFLLIVGPESVFFDEDDEKIMKDRAQREFEYMEERGDMSFDDLERLNTARLSREDRFVLDQFKYVLEIADRDLGLGTKGDKKNE